MLQATDKTSNSKVAIKCLSLRGMKDWKQLDLFERESRILEQLDHRGIPKYIGCFEQDLVDDKRFYIVQVLFYVSRSFGNETGSDKKIGSLKATVGSLVVNSPHERYKGDAIKLQFFG